MCHSRSGVCVGMDVTRPGKEDLVKDIDDVNERIEQLKQLVAQKEKEVGGINI